MAPTTFSTARTELRLTGDHDVSTAAELAATLACAIAQDEDTDLVVDLSGVGFMDASTLTVVLRARSYLQDRRRCLHLRDPSGPCRRLLELCQLGDLVLGDPVTQLALRPDRSTPIPRARRAVPITTKAS